MMSVLLQILVGAHDHKCVDRLWFESTTLLRDVITDFREVVLRLGAGSQCCQDRPRDTSKDGSAWGS